MIVAMWLLVAQGIIGAFDTIYYHEFRARLPALGARAAKELRLHAVRDVLYAVPFFFGLALFEWRGTWAAVLAAVLALEIVFTLWDFVVEIAVRKPLGDVYAGERVTHAIMGILYGAMLVCLLPALRRWWSLPTDLAPTSDDVPALLRWLLVIFGAGVLLSGVRDLLAAAEFRGAAWPWKSP